MGPPQPGANEKALNTIDIDEIRGFFGRAYRPNGAILGVAGRVDWPRPAGPRRRVVRRLEAGVGAGDQRARCAAGRRTHLPHDSNQTQIGIAYRSVPYRDADYYQAAAAVGVLSGGMSSRLFTEVREKRGLCYSVYASHSTLLDRGSVFCYAGTSAERRRKRST